MTRTALVVGGTGPTGPHLADGLEARGYRVTLLHRGTHELPEQARFEHVHADPHFREPLGEALADRRFDVVVASYGRLRAVADALAGRCETFVGVSGLPVYPGYHEPETLMPRGMPILAGETEADVARPAEESRAARFSRLVHEAERHVLDLHDRGAFRAALVRYPSIYGPRQVYPREWSIVKRLLDGRSRLIVPDGGLSLVMRCAAENAAALLLAAVDAPDAAAGQVFNAGDLRQYSLAQWIELIAAALGREIEIVSLPWALAGPGRGLFPLPHTEHVLVSVRKAVEVLSYREVVPPAEALARTVRWYAEHPPDERAMAGMVDEFDYAAEDRIMDEFRAVTAALRARQKPAEVATHPYAHPKTPAEPKEPLPTTE